MNREIVVSFRSSPATWPAGGDDDECVAWEGYPTLPDFAELPLVFTKPGQYSLCADAALPPLSFETAVCTDKFNVRP